MTLYLPSGCEANAITFVLPSNDQLNIELSIEVTKVNKVLTGYHKKITVLA